MTARSRSAGSIACLFVCAVAATAQDSTYTRTGSIALRSVFRQIKDEYNHGLVFSGGDLGVDYRTAITSATERWSYEPQLMMGVMHHGFGGLAAHLQLRPLDLSYARRIGRGDGTPMLGPYGAVNYAWQVYPQLQSGHMFWYSSFELGARVFAQPSIAGRQLALRGSLALLGWASRPSFTNEEYFYSLRFGDFVRNPHRNMLFGGPGLFQHADLEVELLPRNGRRRSLAYAFEFWGYSSFPQVKNLSHSLTLRWALAGTRTK